jgi:hypothetical protein
LPSEESDPRAYLEPNFYYDQEDYLKEFAAKYGISWNTTRPANISGAVPDAAMNLCFPLGVYAVVQRHLRQSLEFPSDFAAWTNIQMLSSAQMNCYLAEWAVLTEDTKNESFNATDDSLFTWEMFWPKLAAFYGIPWKGPDDNGSRTEYHEFQTPYTPPPRGYGPPATIRFKFTLAEWAKSPEVQNAWKEISTEYNLRNIALEDVDRVFGFTDFGISVSYPVIQRLVGFSTLLMSRAHIFPVSSMGKAKKFGFFGFVDASETIYKSKLNKIYYSAWLPRLIKDTLAYLQHWRSLLICTCCLRAHLESLVNDECLDSYDDRGWFKLVMGPYQGQSQLIFENLGLHGFTKCKLGAILA